MAGLIDFLVNQFYSNQFMTAAVVAAPAALITYSLRAVPLSLWNSLKKLSTVELRFNSDMENYHIVQEFVTNEIILRRWSGSFNLHCEQNWVPSPSESPPRWTLGAGYGRHLGWWRGRPVLVSRHLSEGTMTEKFKENVEIVFLGRNLSRMQEFTEEIRAHVSASEKKNTLRVMINSDSSWLRMNSIPLRPLETVITENEQGARAVEHVRRFKEKREWYLQRGLPHHTGIILEGTPGTGKSSLIQAVASETGRHLYYLNLGAIREEEHLTRLLAERKKWDDAILVLEDVDTSGAAVQRKSEGSVTLSTMLNVLDGILSPDGVVVMATTNHPEDLDPALLRPGRFDLCLRLGPLGWESFLKLARLFEVPEEQLVGLREVYRPTTGAVLRSLIISGDSDALREYFESQTGPLKLLESSSFQILSD